MQEKIAILGASRGLGAALSNYIINQCPQHMLLLASRKQDLLSKIARTEDHVVTADFTKKLDQERLLRELEQFAPNQVFYVAGGGPYGRYAEKKFADHMWALELGLVFPAQLIHFLMTSDKIRHSLHRIIVVGSAIAGRNPDPYASAYAAAKHGLRGLILSVQQEKPTLDLRLYEPGYIDTDMLPANAWPRQQEGLVSSREDEARKLWHWSQNSIE